MPITRDQVEEINRLVSVNIKQLLQEDSFIKTITQQVSTIILSIVNETLSIHENKITKVIKEVKSLETNMNENQVKYSTKSDLIEEKIEGLSKATQNIERRYELLDQQSRRNNLRVFNVKEIANENTKQTIISLIGEKMKITLKPEDIETCHRVGNGKDGKSRGILLKLHDHRKRMEIFNAKRNLKGSGIVIKEDLTNIRVKILEEAGKKFSFTNTWTKNGRVFVRSNKHVINILSIEHLNSI